MTNAILAPNAGCSSLKFALFDWCADTDIAPLSRGKIGRIDTAPGLAAHDTDGAPLDESHRPNSLAGSRESQA